MLTYWRLSGRLFYFLFYSGNRADRRAGKSGCFAPQGKAQVVPINIKPSLIVHSKCAAYMSANTFGQRGYAYGMLRGKNCRLLRQGRNSEGCPCRFRMHHQCPRRSPSARRTVFQVSVQVIDGDQVAAQIHHPATPSACAGNAARHGAFDNLAQETVVKQQAILANRDTASANPSFTVLLRLHDGTVSNRCVACKHLKSRLQTHVPVGQQVSGPGQWN